MKSMRALLFLALLIGFLYACQAAPQDILTSEERQWLNEHPGIRLAPDPYFPPIEYFDEAGKYQGLVAEYFALIEQRLGYKFDFVQLNSWSDVLQQAQVRQVDGITAAQITPERLRYLQYTRPIIDIPNVIIVNKNDPRALTFEQMGGMEVAVTRGYALQEYIEEKFPDIVLRPVDDDLQALSEVSFGRADATVVNLAIASYLIDKHGFTNLRIAGDSGKTNVLAIATRNDEPMLNRILDKGLASLTDDEKNAINRRWMQLGSNTAIFNRQFWIILGSGAGAVFLCLGLVLVWNQTLRKQVLSKTHELQEELAERNKVEEKLHAQLQRQSALRAIDIAISASLDLRLVLSIILEQVITLLKLDAADILLLGRYSQTLEYAAGIGFHTRGIENSRLHFGDGTAGQVALTRRHVLISDLPKAENFLRREALAEEQFISYYGVPLVAKGKVKGVLEIFARSPFSPDQEWIDFLETFAGQAAIALDNAGLFEELQMTNSELIQAYEATIEGWSKALDLRDQETEGHSQRVTEVTMKLARIMGMSEEEVVHVRRGALLHDIGKVGIPDGILLKAGPLTDEEMALMRRHPVYAYELLSPIAFLEPALDIPYCHHEKWDGSGYPRGLRNEQIPLAARIFAVVDVWDALCSDRPYRLAWAADKALDYIRAEAGHHFDPAVVVCFLNLIAQEH